MPETIQTWFCLKPGRDSFKPKIPSDCNLVFCHEEQLQDQILTKIEMRYAANEPIKMLIYGDWGVGKTHTAHHIMWWLDQHEASFPAYPVMIELGDIEPKSRFDVIIRPFLDKLGTDFLVELTHAYLAKSSNVVRALQKAGIPEYVATIIGKLNMATPGMTPPPVVPEAINVLKGKKPQAAAAGMGLSDRLTESAEFYAVLAAIGHMYREVHNKRMLFIADEAAKLDEVSNHEATEAHWIASNRNIFDDSNDVFGFIYTLSGKADRLPRAIWDSQIQNRIGAHTVELQPLAAQDVGGFLTKLRDEFVDQRAVEALVASGDIASEEYDWGSYPFTSQARAEFVDFFDRSQQNSKPRDISDRLNTLGFLAMKAKKRLIDEACLQAAEM
jgi:hypothetical protein